jgi:hypothetical protein
MGEGEGGGDLGDYFTASGGLGGISEASFQIKFFLTKFEDFAYS